ncbi:MAG: site-2 protease family protein [Treponema sp.]|jgi:regulator of sigma E protease|nr:site-2 protease family protein [Treponema sp.]
MFVLKILLGLVGLGIVVIIHELGHFIAARAMGIDVEAFSIGWGKPILKKQIGAVEYRLGMFPLGGYCKMRGENEFEEAYNNKREAIPPVQGSFFGAKPWRRIIVAFAGPFFNIVFAALVFSIIWGVGFNFLAIENRIVLASDIGNEEPVYPANAAGLESGDRIIAIDGTPMETFGEIREYIAINAEKQLSVKIERNGSVQDITVTPLLDKSTGAGIIGVYYWLNPVVGEVAPAGPSEHAGLKPDDRILTVNGTAIAYSMALLPLLADQPQTLTIGFERDGTPLQTELQPVYTGEGVDLGFTFKMLEYRTPSLSPFAAISKGLSEAWKMLSVSIKSLALLFKGIDLTQAVSGPVRITYMLGDAATAGFSSSFADGIHTMANFMSFISVALCVMNLLPLPVLDGGLIVLFIIEIFKRGPLNPKFISVFQTAGIVLIFALMTFAIFGDVLYLVRL